MTAWEMVEYFGRLHGLDDEPLRERMEAIFARLQMNEIRDLLGSKMSTGMKQKVSIARAIVHDPPVLIFDEATSGLDVLVARALLKTVAELRDQGKCVLFSTHIMREAEKLCDRMAIVHRGLDFGRGNSRTSCASDRPSTISKSCSSSLINEHDQQRRDRRAIRMVRRSRRNFA